MSSRGEKQNPGDTFDMKIDGHSYVSAHTACYVDGENVSWLLFVMKRLRTRQ